MPLDSANASDLIQKSGKSHHRTLWLSDTHLGTKTCQVDQLLSFLKNNTCDTLYLVGDIIDGWKLKSKLYWPQSHTDVIRRILTMAKRGTRIVFVTGNHDEFLRKYSNRQYGNIELVDEACHTTADNKKLLVLHGDQFDDATNAYSYLSKFFAYSYDDLIEANIISNKLLAKVGLPTFTLPSIVKDKTKISFINEYENWIANTAQERGFNGVICGHIHHAQNKEINGTQYLNCGDWVESCTALAEDAQGNIRVIDWLSEALPSRRVPAANEESANPLELLAELNGWASKDILQKEAVVSI